MLIKIRIILFSTIASQLVLGANAQNSGSLFSKSPLPTVGCENKFIYIPPKGLKCPEKMKARIAYRGVGFDLKEIRIQKEASYYWFKLFLPDSAHFFIAAIVSEQGDLFDNNNGKGYGHSLYNINGFKYIDEGITRVSLLDGFATYFLGLNYSDYYLAKLYEKEMHELVKPDFLRDYFNYLCVLHRLGRSDSKKRLLLFADKVMDEKYNEKNMLLAFSVFEVLKMRKEKENLEAEMVRVFPHGEMAKNKFWKEYYSAGKKDIDYINLSMNKYVSQFQDSTASALDKFLLEKIKLGLANRDIITISEEQKRVQNRIVLAHLLNEGAWNIVSNEKESSYADILFANNLSSKAVDILIIHKQVDNANDNSGDYLTDLASYLDTYAFSFYLLGQYDSGFYFHNMALLTGELSTEGKERHALLAKKAKGAEFARTFIESELSKGLLSRKMLYYLREIYKELSISEEAYSNLHTKIVNEINDKKRKDIRLRLGTEKANDFLLKDLNGRNVSLSDYKNKIIVLDFWATWCIPCLSSFSKLKPIVEKYENSNEVVFLFVNTLETGDLKTIKNRVLGTLKKMELRFNVLLDVKSDVYKKYKVDGIPAVYLVNMRGDIVFMGYDIDDLIFEIESIK